MDTPGRITVLVILILLSAFFSGTETAFTSFNKTRIKTLAGDGSRKAKRVLDIDERYDKFLSTMLVGNNIVNIAASTIATFVFRDFIKGNESLSATVSTIVMTVAVLLFGEITPKILCRVNAEKYTMATAGLVRVIMVIFTPLTAIFSLWQKLLMHLSHADEEASVTEDEILTMVEEATSEGEIDEHESDLIKSAIEFNDLEVSAVLTPRVDIIAAAKDTPLDEIAELFAENGFSRLPVYEDTIDNIIGVIHEKDFNSVYHNGGKSISSIIHEVPCVTEGMKISKLLRDFQAAKTHMAIVVDEYGGTAGIVTLEDVLEGLVGEIWDEHDEVIENIREAGENTYLVNCGMAMGELCDIYPFSDEVLEDNATVNGFVLDGLGKVPEVGDTFTYERLTCEVTRVEGRRAAEIKITVAPETDEDEDDDREKDKDKDKEKDGED